MTGSAGIPYVRASLILQWNAMGGVFTKLYIIFLKHFFTVKEGDKGINLSSIVIPKARGVFPKSLFLVSTPKEMEDINVSLPCVG